MKLNKFTVDSRCARLWCRKALISRCMFGGQCFLLCLQCAAASLCSQLMRKIIRVFCHQLFLTPSKLWKEKMHDFLQLAFSNPKYIL